MSDVMYLQRHPSVANIGKTTLFAKLNCDANSSSPILCYTQTICDAQYPLFLTYGWRCLNYFATPVFVAEKSLFCIVVEFIANTFCNATVFDCLATLVHASQKAFCDIFLIISDALVKYFGLSSVACLCCFLLFNGSFWVTKKKKKSKSELQVLSWSVLY